MNIKYSNRNYYVLNISEIEKQYKVEYIGDFSIKDKHGVYTTKPISIFYQENPKTELGHSNYMGLYCTYKYVDHEITTDKLFICDGKSAFEEPLTGVIADNGQIIISCYTHDYVISDDDSVFVDGGRDYLKTNIDAKIVKIKINKNKFEII